MYMKSTDAGKKDQKEAQKMHHYNFKQPNDPEEVEMRSVWFRMVANVGTLISF